VNFYFSKSDRLQARGLFAQRAHPALAGLPDYCRQTSGHSVSNHLRVVRGSPGCHRRDRLRQSLEDSPTHADRIEFTVAACLVSRCYGLVVLFPLLATSHCWDAVTVRYRTILHRTETDFHRSIFLPAQAHERAFQAEELWPKPEERSAKTEERTWLQAERHSNWPPRWTDAEKTIP
jgi:hypothetical protein